MSERFISYGLPGGRCVIDTEDNYKVIEAGLTTQQAVDRARELNRAEDEKA